MILGGQLFDTARLFTFLSLVCCYNCCIPQEDAGKVTQSIVVITVGSIFLDVIRGCYIRQLSPDAWIRMIEAPVGYPLGIHIAMESHPFFSG